ncbi:helix-turn-helix domain-containing protein [Chryseobacterium indoltheticum]|uniref:helix-turn-helix domain-containing protein n=1 Tax=Chryseobacterium indoltheticum TaxID=254 RepID=UPI003F492FEA
MKAFFEFRDFFNKESHIFTAPYFGNKDFNKVILIERLFKFSVKDEVLYKSAAHNTIESLLLDAHLYITHQDNDIKPKSLYIKHFNKFNFFLQRDFKIAKNVSHYSDLLKVSPRKLTEITERVCSKPAKQIIIDKIKLECLKAIKYSNDPFSEITYKLGFSDEANFTNFVKKHLEKNPSDIRYEHSP